MPNNHRLKSGEPKRSVRLPRPRHRTGRTMAERGRGILLFTRPRSMAFKSVQLFVGLSVYDRCPSFFAASDLIEASTWRRDSKYAIPRTLGDRAIEDAAIK